MSKALFLLSLTVLFILLISFVSAVCEEGQIDINSASEEELQEMVHIGPSRAEQIINLRPFSSVDDMIRISGIGETYLSNIKTQGLACVNEENETESEENAEDKNKNITKPVVDEESEISFTEISKVKEPEVIILNSPKVEEKDNRKPSGNWAVYGFVAISIFVAILFLLKNRNKTEFE